MRRRSFRMAVVASAALWAGSMLATAGSAATGQPPRNPREAQMAEYLPPGSAKALVARECSSCHDFLGVVRLRASKAGWEAVVLDMVARGAPLMIDDADAITAYLSEAFGPKAPPLVDVNAASREDLVKLPGITPALADQVVAHRRAKGPFSSRDEVRVVLGIDAAAFEKVQWYIRAVR